jgi:hypothetical protein
VLKSASCAVKKCWASHPGLKSLPSSFKEASFPDFFFLSPLRLFGNQLELNGRLLLSRDNVRWLFEIAAVGIEVRWELVALETILLAVAPIS